MYSRPPQSRKRHLGFTLAELLIVLAILGVIATFTIPKIITGQQNGSNLAKAKETVAMVSGAYQQAKALGSLSSATKPTDLTQYMNYIKLDTSGTLIDAHPGWVGSAGGGTNACDSTRPCAILHDGGVLQFTTTSFGSANTNNMVQFYFDPDGVAVGGTADGPSKSVGILLYYNGQITSRDSPLPSSGDSAGCCLSTNSAFTPSWFTW